VNNPEATTRPTTRRWWIRVAAIAVVLIAVVGGTVYAFGTHHNSPAVVDPSMAALAQQVMPFDLNRTTHTFTQTADGGVETIVANDTTDTRDIALIRSHLQTEAENFRHGNYSDPAKIHGMDMPGVNDLQQGAARVNVVYAELPNGAQITYTAKEPGLVSAIHAWFDRQTSDHSMPGMGG
jgi:hypothetical protein